MSHESQAMTIDAETLLSPTALPDKAKREVPRVINRAGQTFLHQGIDGDKAIVPGRRIESCVSRVCFTTTTIASQAISIQLAAHIIAWTSSCAVLRKLNGKR
jgi:hypothetical protein